MSDKSKALQKKEVSNVKTKIPRKSVEKTTKIIAKEETKVTNTENKMLSNRKRTEITIKALSEEKNVKPRNYTVVEEIEETTEMNLQKGKCINAEAVEEREIIKKRKNTENRNGEKAKTESLSKEKDQEKSISLTVAKQTITETNNRALNTMKEIGKTCAVEEYEDINGKNIVTFTYFER